MPEQVKEDGYTGEEREKKRERHVQIEDMQGISVEQKAKRGRKPREAEQTEVLLTGYRGYIEHIKSLALNPYRD